MTRVHRVELLLVDHDDVGAAEVQQVLENANYPNDCVRPKVMRVDTRTVAWSDDHPLNSSTRWRAAALDLFAATPETVWEAPAATTHPAHGVEKGGITSDDRAPECWMCGAWGVELDARKRCSNRAACDEAAERLAAKTRVYGPGAPLRSTRRGFR